jgi:hypothetical protein
MPESHQHVDLDVLHLVERLLSRGDASPDTASDQGSELIHLPSATPPGADASATHPAGHVPEQPLIAREPVTPLPRRR